MDRWWSWTWRSRRNTKRSKSPKASTGNLVLTSMARFSKLTVLIIFFDYCAIDKIVPPCACPSWSSPESPSVMVRSFLTLWCPLFIDNNLKTSCRSLMYWLCKFITAAFIWTHDIKLEIRATNKEATTLLYAMFVYNARREDWIQENGKRYSKISGYDRPHVYVFVSDKKISTLESVFKNFRIQPENTLDTCGREPYS